MVLRKIVWLSKKVSTQSRTFASLLTTRWNTLMPFRNKEWKTTWVPPWLLEHRASICPRKTCCCAEKIFLWWEFFETTTGGSRAPLRCKAPRREDSENASKGISGTVRSSLCGRCPTPTMGSDMVCIQARRDTSEVMAATRQFAPQDKQVARNLRVNSVHSSACHPRNSPPREASTRPTSWLLPRSSARLEHLLGLLEVLNTACCSKQFRDLSCTDHV